jgi:hypothetical protein
VAAQEMETARRVISHHAD